MQINTTQAIADMLGTSKRRVQQLIKELGIRPVMTIGRAQILSDADVRRLELRNTQVGRPAKKKEK